MADKPVRDRGTRFQRRVAPASTPSRRTPWLWIGLGGGAAVLVVVLLVLAGGSRGSTEPPAEVRKPPRTVATKPSEPPPKEKVLTEKIEELAKRDTPTARNYKTLHALWTELLSQAKGTSKEAEIQRRLESIADRAKREYDSARSAVEEKRQALLAARKPAEAKRLVSEWTALTELDLDGSREAVRQKDLALLDQWISLENTRSILEKQYGQGQTAANPERSLAAFLKSDHPPVRAAAEQIIAELSLLRVQLQIRQKFEARRAMAIARIEEVRKEIVRDAAAEKERSAAWERRLKEFTAKTPISLKQFGFDMDRPVQVQAFDGRKVTIGGKGLEMGLPVQQLPGDLFGRLLAAAADPANPRELFEAGKMAVRAQALDAAEKLLGSAARLDPSLTAVLPDLDRIRRSLGSLRGEASLSGDTIQIEYDFKTGEQDQDFKPRTPVKARGSNLGLHLSGRGIFIASVRDLKLLGKATLSCRTQGGSGSAGHAVGAVYELLPGELDAVLSLVLPGGSWKVVRLSKESQPQTLAEGSGADPSLVEVRFDHPKISLSSGGKELWSGAASPAPQFLPVFGGAGSSDAEVVFASLRIEGRMESAWIQRLLSERATTIESELSKEAKATREERGAAAVVSGADFAARPVQPIPLETELAGVLPSKVGELLKTARSLLTEKFKTRQEFEAAGTRIESLLDEAVAAAPWLPLTYYYRAEWKHLRQDAAGAAADLDEALKRQENFVEARVGKAELLLSRLKYDEARRELERALQEVPDLPPARLTMALLDYYGGRNADALSELDLAVRLAPSDLALRRQAKRLRNSVTGPFWSDAAVHETPYHIVKVEIPNVRRKGRKGPDPKQLREAAKRYAEELKTTREWYAQAVPGKQASMMKPIVYVFDTPEGYYTHADFALEGRHENTCGVYLQQFRQFLFFVADSEEETLQTMRHEAFHEYLHTVAPQAPIWFNEGMAEYASALRIKNGHVEESGLLLAGRLGNLRAAMDRHRWEGTPFEVLMNETPPQFMDPGMAALNYAQSWSMMHFFHHGKGGAHKPLIEEYARKLSEGVAAGPAYAATFAKQDLTKLRKEWREYVKSLFK